MATCEAYHFAINMYVAPFLSGPVLLALCQTHRDFRSFSESFIAKTHEMMAIKNTNLNERFSFAAKTGSRALCELARAATDSSEINWNHMLGEAARGGYRELCELARKWDRETPWLPTIIVGLDA